MATMVVPRTVSEINGDFSWKSQKNPPRVFCVPAQKCFPSELGTVTGDQTTKMMRLPGRERSLTISSAAWIQSTNVTDRRSDGQTDVHLATAKTALTHRVAR